MDGMKTVLLMGLAAVALLAHEAHAHAPEDLASGKQLYRQKCAGCHAVDGRGASRG